MKKKIFIKRMLLGFLSIILIFQYLNWTGFCYDEQRYLSEEEIIDRAVRLHFEDHAEKQNIYRNNPYCCELMESTSVINNSNVLKLLYEFFIVLIVVPESINNFDSIVDNILNCHVNEVHFYYKNGHNKRLEKMYYMDIVGVNSCATKRRGNFGIDISEEEYRYNIERIKQNQYQSKNR